MLTVEDYGRIRRGYRDGMSIREISRRLHHSRRNPLRAKEIADTRHDKFQALLAKVERSNNYLKDHKRAGVDIQLRDLKAYADKLKILSWLDFNVDDRSIHLSQDEDRLEVVSRLDGCYVIKTDLTIKQCDAQRVHDRYKDLSQVEYAFRTMKTGFLEVRPVYVRKAKRTRGHVFITMLAYMIIHEIRRLIPVGDGMTMKEILARLKAVALVELQDDNGAFYRVPEPDKATLDILNQLGVSIPSVFPKQGLLML